MEGLGSSQNVTRADGQHVPLGPVYVVPCRDALLGGIHTHALTAQGKKPWNDPAVCGAGQQVLENSQRLCTVVV